MIAWTGLDTQDGNDGTSILTRPLMHIYGYKGVTCCTIVPIDFVTDLWSIPKCVRWIFDQYGDGNKYAVEHDWHGAAHTIPRRDADILLRQNMILDGRFTPLQYNLVYAAVRVGATILPKDTTREVCRNRLLAGLFKGDYTSVDPKTVPRPLWPDGISRQSPQIF